MLTRDSFPTSQEGSALWRDRFFLLASPRFSAIRRLCESLPEADQAAERIVEEEIAPAAGRLSERSTLGTGYFSAADDFQIECSAAARGTNQARSESARLVSVGFRSIRAFFKLKSGDSNAVARRLIAESNKESPYLLARCRTKRVPGRRARLFRLLRKEARGARRRVRSFRLLRKAESFRLPLQE